MLRLLYFIYFFCGMAQCIESVFLPEFKQWFAIGYQQQMYIMVAKNIPFVLAGAIGVWLARSGPRIALRSAMALYSAGTLLLLGALGIRQLWLLLAGFLLVGTGFNIQLVAGNPAILGAGDSADASSRLNLANALGAVAQILAPLLVWFLLPTGLSLTAEVPWIQGLFAVMAGVFLCLVFISKLVPAKPQTRKAVVSTEGRLPGRFWWGLAAVILALGAEASCFGFFRNYLEDKTLGGMTPSQSQVLFTVYLGLFAIGRLSAAVIQTRLAAWRHLLIHLLGAIASVTLLLFAHGTIGVVLFVSLGFWISIFFPTLYALSIEGLGSVTPRASGLLTMGFLGAAFFPLLQGHVADSIGLQHSFACCLTAYVLILPCALVIMQRGTYNDVVTSSPA